MQKKITNISTGTPAEASLQESHRSERGQSMLEFSFILVILLILIAGISDLGRGLFTYIAMRDAAQEGALYASINPTAVGSIKNRVINSSDLVHELAVGGGTPPPLTVQVSYLGAACYGNGVQVSVTYQKFPITMPFLGTILGAQHIPIRASIIDTIITPACP